MMQNGVSMLEFFLAVAIVCLAAAAAAPSSRQPVRVATKADLQECRRTSESALRRMYCAERLTRLERSTQH
jgi:Tfp pilus assembly protein PilE